MKQAVLADSGPLYAALDPSDSHHGQAVRELEEFAKRRFDVIVSYSTLLEAYPLVLYKLGRRVALRWLHEMEEAALINPTVDDYRQATSKVAAFADQSITLFDATVAVMASRIGVPVWTYDHHFDVIRVPVWR